MEENITELFEIGDILKTNTNYKFHYKVKDFIIWNNTQIMRIEPIDLLEPERNGTYDDFVVVNDPIKNLFKKVI